MSWAIQHRVRNRQPDGGSIGLGYVAEQLDPLAGPLPVGIGNRDRREQRLGVWVRRRAVDLVPRADLDDLAEIHHGDAIGDVADDGQVVGDEQVGEPELVLQLIEQVDDAGLDAHVERRHRLVEDDELRLDRQRPGDPDALALTAGELVGVPVGVLGRQADES